MKQNYYIPFETLAKKRGKTKKHNVIDKNYLPWALICFDRQICKRFEIFII